MKLIKAIALAMVLLLCMVPALAEGSSRIDELAHTIKGEISCGKYPHDLMIMWMDDYTVAEFEEAAVKAVKSCVANPPAFFTMEPLWESYLDGSFFESEEYLSILAEYGLTRAGSTTPAFPKTGDGANLMLWSSLLLVSAIGMTAMMRRKPGRS